MALCDSERDDRTTKLVCTGHLLQVQHPPITLRRRDAARWPEWSGLVAKW